MKTDFPSCPCPLHGARCDVVGTHERRLTWRCGRTLSVNELTLLAVRKLREERRGQ
jgi:hypothetical protein